MIVDDAQRNTAGTAGAVRGGVDIAVWNPEDEAFWASRGWRIARRNLCISTLSLLCGFAVWAMWGIITVQMFNLGFPFKAEELFTLAAISGLSGATLRISSSFLIRLAGGRNTIFLTTALLIVPALGTGLALQDRSTPLWVFQLLALLSGIGAGNFASSMSNISSFFPKRLQGTALGINAGIGNFGVTATQVLVPLAMTVGVLGALGGEPMLLAKDSGWIFGRIEAGTPTFIQNAGFVWVVVLVPLTAAAWFGMNNLLGATPGLASTGGAFARIVYLLALTLAITVLGLYLHLPAPTGLGLLDMWVTLPLIMIATLLVIRVAVAGEMRANIAGQFAIFGNRHTWSMSMLYVLTFGSFIGFSMALPLSIAVIFGVSHVVDPATGLLSHTLKNPNAPSALTYAWLGPFVGALGRPIGGWLADRIGGSVVTQAVSATMLVASVGAGYLMMQAYQSATPEQHFIPFLAVFIVLFAATGIGNGSTFRTIGVVFDRAQAGPALGWASAMAAYGAFIAPVVIGRQIKAGTPEVAMYGFAGFYALCLLLNWWFYLRRGAEIRNP
ncbi:MAG: MFS transporter [Rhodocyclaceae bacterium]|nr:MFS transporter [Rhodocyclaceae bacterium]